jgi:hypothetical protein
MRRIVNLRWQRSLPCLFALLVLVPNSGCIAAAVTAGVAGAGAGGYFYVQGNVLHDYNADPDHTWTAALLSLKDLGLPVKKADREKDGSGTIISQTGDGDKITITLEPKAARIPAEGQWTHVGVRVAMFGDSPVSERIIHQIDFRLAPPGTPPLGVPVETAPPPLTGH